LPVTVSPQPQQAQTTSAFLSVSMWEPLGVGGGKAAKHVVGNSRDPRLSGAIHCFYPSVPFHPVSMCSNFVI
jgi:hypothetical protein